MRHEAASRIAQAMCGGDLAQEHLTTRVLVELGARPLRVRLREQRDFEALACRPAAVPAWLVVDAGNDLPITFVNIVPFGGHDEQQARERAGVLARNWGWRVVA